MPVHCFRCPILLALSLAASAGALAEGADDLRFFAAQGLVHDSNLFRLPSNANTQALIGRSSAAETIGITTLGARYSRSYSLQQVELDMRVTNYQYQNFGYLGFLATNYRAAWRWSYTPHLYGNLSTSRDQSLNSFIDFRGFNQRNERIDTRTRFDAAYELDARWRLQGGLTRTARSNQLAILEEGDYRANAFELGGRYVLPSGSSAGYTLRSTDGSYANRPFPSAGGFDNGYSQLDNEMRVKWAISRDTSADFMVGHRHRSHPNYPQRDYSNLVGSASVNWAYSGKSGLSAGWTRELETFETANFNYTQVDRFSVGPVWQVSPKTTVRLRLEHAIRDFRGTPAGFATAQRRDTTNDASVSLDWEPYRFLLISASLQNSRRSSSSPGLGYNSNIINVNAQLTY